jgi:hypothetical protein
MFQKLEGLINKKDKKIRRIKKLGLQNQISKIRRVQIIERLKRFTN